MEQGVKRCHLWRKCALPKGSSYEGTGMDMRNRMEHPSICWKVPSKSRSSIHKVFSNFKKLQPVIDPWLLPNQTSQNGSNKKSWNTKTNGTWQTDRQKKPTEQDYLQGKLNLGIKFSHSHGGLDHFRFTTRSSEIYTRNLIHVNVTSSKRNILNKKEQGNQFFTFIISGIWPWTEYASDFLYMEHFMKSDIE